MSARYEDRKKWFFDRIGKRVFRNKNTCSCFPCKRVYEEGLVIEDTLQALYLLDMESEFTAEGEKLRYFDTQEEAKEFELNS